MLDGILWILRTGAPWKDLPERYPPYPTCHRRFQQWVRSGTLERVLHPQATDLKERGGLDLSECFIDGTFVAAKNGGLHVGATQRGKGAKVLAVADRAGLPLAIDTASASPHEVTRGERTLAATFVDDLPERLIGDRPYDSDPLDAALADGGVEMIAPNRRGTRPTQDRRKLRRYRRRWKIERLFAWLGTSAAGWFATRTMRRTSLASFTWVVSSSCCGRVEGMVSRPLPSADRG